MARSTTSIPPTSTGRERELQALVATKSGGNYSDDDDDDHSVDDPGVGPEHATIRTKTLTTTTFAAALLLVFLLLLVGNLRAKSSKALVRRYHSLDQLRLDIAAVSIEMMQENTAEAANRSQMIDIDPLYNLIDGGLDEFGVRGIYTGLFELHKFVDALRTVAEAKGLQDFKVAVFETPDHQSYTKYEGIPNDRKYYQYDSDNTSGGMWWLMHYVGAITADKLLREGSLLLGGSNNNFDRLYGAAAFMHELQRIERLENSDLMVFHAQHGFIWHYLVSEMPMLDSYPLEVAEAFCGDLLWKDEWIEHVKNDMARECRHGFGHGVYMVLAVRETMGFDAYSVRQQFRPVSGFLLSEESLCEAYKICSGAPNEKTLKECKGAMRHSYMILGAGDTFADGSHVVFFLMDQEKPCAKAQQASTPVTSGEATAAAIQAIQVDRTGLCKCNPDDLTRECLECVLDGNPFPFRRYIEWDEVGSSTRSVAHNVFGYNMYEWNNLGNKDIDKVSWKSMSDKEQDAAEELDFNQESWDCWMNHYSDYGWDELIVEGIDGYFRNLGWSRGRWENGIPPSSDDKDWNELDEDEKYAAWKLCYFEYTWGEEDLCDWDWDSIIKKHKP